MTAIDKAALRLTICLAVGVLGYGIASNYIVNQIADKSKDIESKEAMVDAQIKTINSQITDINSGKSAYDSMYSALYAIQNPPEVSDSGSEPSSDTSYTTLDTTIPKNAIPNLLNRIVYIIPREVRVTSIRNTEGRHIVIQAQASKYEQLGYFRAALSTSGCLNDVKSTSGQKSGGTVVITIEGELP